MILFLRDWIRFPNACVDYSTTNESFLRQVNVYQQMGIKNCLWPLALMQPELRGVDPHSALLSFETKQMIALECRFNPWYYFREVVRIPPVAGPNPIPFKANRGNLALIWAFLNSVDFALIQPRQTGKSVSTDCLMTWLIYIGASNSRINMITKDDALRRANVERLKKIRDLLPPYIVSKTKADSDNQYELTCKTLQNIYGTAVAQSSEAAANNLGRGLTSPINHIDEGPFITFIGTTLPAALASGTAAREEAQRNGRPYGNIFTTTAGKKDDRDGKFMYDFIMGGAYWNEVFLDARDRNELIEMIKRNCSGNKTIINGTFSHRQLGRSDEWLFEAIANSGATGDAANRDFFNVWTSGTRSSPLSPRLNDLIRNSEKDPLHSEISKDLYITRWYIPEHQIGEFMENGHFVVCLDTSEAVGRDAIGFVVIDIRDLSVVAAASYNETNLIRFANFIADFLIKYRNTTLIIEKKSTGQMIIDSLLLTLPRHGIDPFKRLYNRVVEAGQENQDDWRAIRQPLERRESSFYDRYKSKFGFNTTSESRNLLYSSVLPNAAKRAGHMVHDKQLSAEIRGLVVKNDRIDHSASGHDDMVISWLLGHWLLTHSKNLAYYGIDSSIVLREVNEEGRILSPEEQWEQERQRQIRDEIEVTVERLRSARDEFTSMRLEHKLRNLLSQLDEENSEAQSVDALIQQVKEARQNAARIASRRSMANTPLFNRAA